MMFPVSLLPAALEAIVSHPDEMEHLEQYRVLAVYERKDSHQVNLVANQLVYVIEKHDTGEICDHNLLYCCCCCLRLVVSLDCVQHTAK